MKPELALLSYASRIQAAVQSYCSVKDVADKEKWKTMFLKEMVRCTILTVSNLSRFVLEKRHRRA